MHNQLIVPERRRLTGTNIRLNTTIRTSTRILTSSGLKRDERIGRLMPTCGRLVNGRQVNCSLDLYQTFHPSSISTIRLDFSRCR